LKHGGDIYKTAKDLQCNPEKIIDFSSNINLYQPEIALKIDPKIVARYAEPSHKELKNIIAQNYALSSNQIALYNGATTAIYELFKSLKRDQVFLYAPLYSEYEKAARATQKDIYKINRISDIDDEALEESIVVFVNPSTPEGTYCEDIEKLLAKWIELECTIILDESFLEFEALQSMREKITSYKRLYIIQSFSKFHASAGVRIGAIFSNKKNIKKLPKPLWNISSLDSMFLMQRVQDEAFKHRSRELHLQQKAELKTILQESELFDEIVESDANFILTHSTRGEELFEHLLTHKILVRKCASFDYLTNDWLRFALKDKASQKTLKEAMSLFKEKPAPLE